MTGMEGKVNRVRRRLALLELSGSAAKLLFYLSAIAALLVFIDRLLHVGRASALIAAGLAAAAALTWLTIAHRRINAGYAARRIDGAFGLQERISTALAMTRCDEPMVPALVADAERHADRIDSSRFRFRPPRQLKLLPAPMLALAVGLWVVPPMDIFGRAQREEKREAERKEVKKQAEHMAIKARQLRDRTERHKLPSLKRLALEMQRLADDLSRSPGTKQQAMVRMSRVADKVRKRREKLFRAEKFEGLDLRKSETLAGKTAQLGESKKGMQRLAEALQEGDFADATEALEDLAEKLKEGRISADEAPKLGEALKELAKNMPADDQLTQAVEQLGEQLSCKDAEALQRALQEMQLTQQQMLELQGLMQEMDASNFALDILDYEQLCLSCNRPTRICKTCGNPVCAGCGTFDCVCCPVSIGPDGGPCCRGCQGLGTGLGMGGRGGLPLQRGPVGGRGGQGPRPVAPEHPVDFKPTRLPPNLGPGKILATQFLRGMPPGDADAKSAYRDVLQAAQKMAEDAIHREDIPPQCREKIKRYFEDLQQE